MDPGSPDSVGSGGSDGSGDKQASSAGKSSGRFTCTVCGQAFQRKNGLSRHMRSHTGEKPFACSFCKFKSTRTDSLQRHMKLHMNPDGTIPTASTSVASATNGAAAGGRASMSDAAKLMAIAAGTGGVSAGARLHSGAGAGLYAPNAHHQHPAAANATPLPMPASISSNGHLSGPGMGAGAGAGAGGSSFLPPPPPPAPAGAYEPNPYGHAAAPVNGLGAFGTPPLGASPALSSASSSRRQTQPHVGANGNSGGSSGAAGRGSLPTPGSRGAGGASPSNGGLSRSPAQASVASQPAPSHAALLGTAPPPPFDMSGSSGAMPPPPAAPGSHHRAVWNAQKADEAPSLLIPPPRMGSVPGPQGGPPGYQNAGSYAPALTIEGFPTTERFDFGRLFSPGLNDETNLGFGSYITQAASIFSPARNFSMAEQQEAGLSVFGDLSNVAAEGASTSYGGGAANEPVPASPPPSNRHLSLFVNNFNRHLPFIHAPTVPRLYEDILDEEGNLKTTSQAKQIDGLKPCTEDLLRAMAIVGANYDGMADSAAYQFAPGSSADANASAKGSSSASDAAGGASESRIGADWYGAAELKAKLLGDFADNPPSTTRATFSFNDAAGGAGDLDKDFLAEPTLLRRAQSLALVQFVSLFSKSRPHQNHARLLHGALITIGRELLQETQHRENLARQRAQRSDHLTEYEQWREWVRRAERKRTLWAISVCDVLQSILFHVPPWLSASELGSLEVGDLGDEPLWEATSATEWSALKATLPAQPLENDSLSKRSFTIRNLVRSLLEVAEDPSQAALGVERSSASARMDPASKLDLLGPCAKFSAIVALCGHAVEVGRMDYASRHQLRQQAGLPHIPVRDNHGQAVAQAQSALASFSEEDLGSFQYDVGELDNKLVLEANKIDNGLQRWFSKAGSSHGVGGSRPCVTETMAFYYSAQHYVLQLRQRVAQSLPWEGAQGLDANGAPQDFSFLEGSGSNGANLLSAVSRGNGHSSLNTILNLISADPATPNSPDDVMRLIVRIRRSLKSIDGGAALLGYLGTSLLTECAMEWGQGKDFEPDVDGATFLGFFPRLR